MKIDKHSKINTKRGASLHEVIRRKKLNFGKQNNPLPLVTSLVFHLRRIKIFIMIEG